MTTRTPLILLVHRIPYPPNKGDKIRSYHLLRFLAERYEVHLGAFVDDPADWPHRDGLADLCASIKLVRLPRRLAAMRSLSAFVSGQPLTVPWYRSGGLMRWVEQTFARTGARRLLAFSAAMAQFADAAPPGTRCVLDMVDVDSEKWRQYGERHGGPLGWVYRREAHRLLAWECRVAAAFDSTVLVTPEEVKLLVSAAPEIEHRVHAVESGVDTRYFDPAVGFTNPYPAGSRPLVFTGAMDYWANVDAVCWFADEVFPRLRERCPDARFYIAGARPSATVRELARRPGIEVVGAVPDMRPWLAHARLVVAPLRVARGIQNKVLEGLAMARPVLATPMALEGLDLGSEYPLRSEQPEDFARRAGEILDGEGVDHLGTDMRAWVCERYDWSARLQPMAALLEGNNGTAETHPTARQRLAG